MSYTNEKKLTIADLRRLRDKYNSAGEFNDRGFMNELFHGLDGIIEDAQETERTRTELVYARLGRIMSDFSSK